ncbi:unnamed protein product [Strongylus vulgaris]|uniref:Uncharacterized protein n=1 Tax=Strongylus vulgaris TaxID=40348 RepID=A0A3P7L384_STRVU|nr:unnamed protein product [Strongylus vulgaris]
MDPVLMEFSDVCRYFLGKSGEYIAVGFSVIVLLGGIMVYWVLMSNFLFYTGTVVYEALQPNSSTIPIMENKTFTCDGAYESFCVMFSYAFSLLSDGRINTSFVKRISNSAVSSQLVFTLMEF